MPERGPVCHLDAGDYRAVVHGGVPMIERVNMVGAVWAVEWESRAQELRWRESVMQEERERLSPRARPSTPERV